MSWSRRKWHLLPPPPPPPLPSPSVPSFCRQSVFSLRFFHNPLFAFFFALLNVGSRHAFVFNYPDYDSVGISTREFGPFISSGNHLAVVLHLTHSVFSIWNSDETRVRTTVVSTSHNLSVIFSNPLTLCCILGYFPMPILQFTNSLLSGFNLPLKVIVWLLNLDDCLWLFPNLHVLFRISFFPCGLYFLFVLFNPFKHNNFMVSQNSSVSGPQYAGPCQSAFHESHTYIHLGSASWFSMPLYKETYVRTSWRQFRNYMTKWM